MVVVVVGGGAELNNKFMSLITRDTELLIECLLSVPS